MNNLEQASGLLKSGKWCSGDLHQGDKHCAVGALSAVMFSNEQILERAKEIYPTVDFSPENSNKGIYSYLEDTEYRMVRESQEAKALAEVIIEQNPEWYNNIKTSIDTNMKNGDYDNVILMFNDDQEEPEPVIAMFDKAAVKMYEL